MSSCDLVKMGAKAGGCISSVSLDSMLKPDKISYLSIGAPLLSFLLVKKTFFTF
jgi:hypothetical protein